MVKDTLVLPLFNDATLAEVKEYMQGDKQTDYLFDEESVNTPIEVILKSMEPHRKQPPTLQ